MEMIILKVLFMFFFSSKSLSTNFIIRSYVLMHSNSSSKFFVATTNHTKKKYKSFGIFVFMSIFLPPNSLQTSKNLINITYA